MAMDYEKASAVVEACMTRSRELGVAVSVCVMDEQAQPVLLARMTGARRGTTSWAALGKTMVAAVWGAPSEEISKRVPEQAREHAQAMYGHRFVFLPGGFPLMEGDTVVGAVGVSGAAGGVDGQVAEAGVEAFTASLP